jgi:hypothetical protein
MCNRIAAAIARLTRCVLNAATTDEQNEPTGLASSYDTVKVEVDFTVDDASNPFH